jgi:hypothetical protein
MASSWNSVEIATLAVAALTPLTVAGLGYFVSRTGRRIERIQWANQTVVSRRLEIFGQVAPGLNQLLCFATFVGGWKDIDPRQAIAVKRKLDETIYANRLLFSDTLFTAYHSFMTAMFAMYATTDADALLRAPIDSIWGDRRNMTWWTEATDGLFEHDADADSMASIQRIQDAHDRLAQAFRADLYVTHEARPLLDVKP